MVVLALGISSTLCAQSEITLLSPDPIKATIEKAITTGEGQQFRARSVGFNGAGEEVAEFFITWSFKSKVRH